MQTDCAPVLGIRQSADPRVAQSCFDRHRVQSLGSVSQLIHAWLSRLLTVTEC
jgi:hypothetical protein